MLRVSVQPQVVRQMLAFCQNSPIILMIIFFLMVTVTLLFYSEGAFELEMLPAQIPLTQEHLFPTPSSSNARTALSVLFFFPREVPVREASRPSIHAHRAQHQIWR
jgi:hypothetical protein